MGNSTWDPGTWTSMSTARAYATTSAHDIFAKKADRAMVARTITVREAFDSPANPESTPVILALDCTGSMTRVLKAAISKFDVIIRELIDEKPITDPAIMTMFFDDIECYGGEDVLQVSQFESDTRAVEQLEKMCITGHGGGNDSESYHLPLYMAAFKTDVDSVKKRNKKGYMFIVGDESCPPDLTPEQIKAVFGPDEKATESLSYDDLYAAASQKFEVFHVIVMQGSYAGSRGDKAMMEKWTPHCGQNVIVLTDIESLAEVIVGVIRVREGHDRDAVASKWSGTTAVAVREATKGVVARGAGGPGTGIVTL